jgi:hypothetical protein
MPIIHLINSVVILSAAKNLAGTLGVAAPWALLVRALVLARDDMLRVTF